MIGKIFSAADSADNAVWYSEKKTDKAAGVREGKEEIINGEDSDDSHLVAVKNVPEDSYLLDEFNRLKKLNKTKKKTGRKFERPGFHMVLNAGDSDRRLSEAEALELIEKIMKDLCYGDCPYAVYYHDDIDRKHFHIASIRIGQDGMKIDDSFEEERLQKILWSYSKKYGYRIGNQETPEEKRAANENKNSKKDAKQKDNKSTADGAKTRQNEKETAKKKGYVPKFSRRSDTPVFEQLKDIFNDALTWTFSTNEQFSLLMKRRYNVSFVFKQNSCEMLGNDESGKPDTIPITSTDMGVPMQNLIQGRIDEFHGKKKIQSRKHIEETAEWAAGTANSLHDFLLLLSQKGIFLSIAWSKERRPFGMTWIDNRNKHLWKASETSTDLKWLLETGKEKGWDISLKQPEKHQIKPMRIEPVNDDGKKASQKTTEQNSNIPRIKAPRQSDFVKELARNTGNGNEYIGGTGESSDDIYVDETKRRMSATTSVPND